MKNSYTDKVRRLVEYLEVEAEIIHNLSDSPVSAAVRLIDATIVIMNHANATGIDLEEPKKIPLIVKLAIENLQHEMRGVPRDLKRNPRVLAKVAQLEANEHADIKEAITEEMVQASQLALANMPKLKKSPSPLNAEQKKIFLNMLNVLLVNTDTQSELEQDELDEMLAKGIHQIKKHAYALGLADDVFEQDKDLAIRLRVLDSYASSYAFDDEPLRSLYPHRFYEKQLPLTPEEIKQATRILFNKNQLEIVDKLKSAFEMHADKVKENKPLLDALIDPLRVALKSFSDTGNLVEFKKAANQILKDSQSTIVARAEPSAFKSLYNAVVFVLRSFFRIFDHIISTLTFREKLMRDTQTPLAMRATGKMHFFTYCDNPLPEAAQAKASLETLKSVFDSAIEKFEKMGESSHQQILALN